MSTSATEVKSIQLLAVSSFGLRDAGKIMGVITFLETMGSALGTRITGMLAKADGGDYRARSRV